MMSTSLLWVTFTPDPKGQFYFNQLAFCLLWYWSVLPFFCRKFRYKVRNVRSFESLHITFVLQLDDTTLQEGTLPNLHFSVEGGRYWSPDLIFALFSVLREKNTILPYLMCILCLQFWLPYLTLPNLPYLISLFLLDCRKWLFHRYTWYTPAEQLHHGGRQSRHHRQHW